MKKKLTTLLFGLLLAVGWTSSASAQKLHQGKPWYQSAFFQKMTKPMMTGNSRGAAVELSFNRQLLVAEDANGPISRAPMRANYNQTAPVTHVKSWYDAKHYTWYDVNGVQQPEASYTDAVTDSCQMFWFIRSLYSDPTMPGIKYSYAQDIDLAYEGCDFGYWISGDIQQDIKINMTSNCYITAIYVYDYAGQLITSYDADDGTTLPTGWSMPNQSAMSHDREYVSAAGAYWYYWRFTNTSYTDFYPAFIISKDLLAGKGGVYVDVVARNTSSTANRNNTYKVLWYSYNDEGYYGGNSEAHLMNNQWHTYESMVNAPVTPPNDDANGYTVVLVKLKDDVTDYPPEYTFTDSALYNYYNKYVKELQLLTDGLRVNVNTPDAGTLFAYTGDLNWFYFISKGKLYPFSGSENAWMTDADDEYVRFADRAPFYHMYEEFSPYLPSGHEDHSDFYSELRKGVTYPVVHDCQSVNFMQHFFAMTGTQGSAENRVNSLVLYIPDNRGVSNDRIYNTDHQPTWGMYMVDLFADIAPSSTEGFYTTTVTWEDNLDAITHSEGIPQIYYLYQVIGNDTICVTPNGTDQTTWHSADYGIEYEAGATAYEIHYYVVATPRDATNPETFYAQSSPDNVTVPGTSDFIGLQWWRYESDYVTKDSKNTEVNYYRNWLAPHKLSLPGQAGISAGNVGAGRKLTLYRNETPVIDLELVMDGNKAYYRIKYRDANNQEIEPGYGSDGEVDPNYNPNNN